MRGNYLLAMALLGCTACGDSGPAGTSTGNPTPMVDAGSDGSSETDTGGLAAGGYCDAGDKTPLELDEDSPLGFSPNDILAFTEGQHEAPLRWNPQMNVTYGPETGEGRVTITVTPKGTARYVEPAEQGNTDIGFPAIDTIGGCTAWIEIDVEVDVASEGGALDESFDAIVRTHTDLSALLYASLEPDELGGAFAVTASGALEGFTVEHLYLNVSFSTFGVGGTFNGLLERNDGNGSSVGGTGREPFADFGFAKCNDGGFAVGLSDEIEGATVQEALDAFAAHDEVDITWETGTATTSSLAFASAEEGGCVLLDNETTGDLTLVIDGALTMASEDGRLDGEWPGRLEAHVAADGSFSRVEFLLDDGLFSNIMIGAAYYGFPNEDISSYDAAGVSVGVSVSGDALSGSATLTGYAYAEDCAAPLPPDAPDGEGSDADPESGGAAGTGSSGGSAPGCRGADPTIIANASLQ